MREFETKIYLLSGEAFEEGCNLDVDVIGEGLASLRPLLVYEFLFLYVSVT